MSDRDSHQSTALLYSECAHNTAAARRAYTTDARSLQACGQRQRMAKQKTISQNSGRNTMAKALQIQHMQYHTSP
jgi:hypothetical protein